jgi:hypothetical protein
MSVVRIEGVAVEISENKRFSSFLCPNHPEKKAIVSDQTTRMALFCPSGCTEKDLSVALVAGIRAALSNGSGKRLEEEPKPDQEQHASNGYGQRKAEKPEAAANGRGSMLPYAIAYARRGFGVFPVHDIESGGQCSCGKLNCSSAGKHPRLKDWQKLATTGEVQMEIGGTTIHGRISGSNAGWIATSPCWTLTAMRGARPCAR